MKLGLFLIGIWARREYLDLLRTALFAAGGTAAALFITTLSGGLREAMREEAKTILGADLVVGFSTPPGRDDLDWIHALGAGETEETITTAMSLAGEGKTAQRVQLHTIHGEFPFYQRLGVDDERSAWNLLQTQPDALVVEQRYLRLTQAKIGDRVEIGGEKRRIAAAIKSTPGEFSTLGRLDPIVYQRMNGALLQAEAPSYRTAHRLWFRCADVGARSELTEKLTAYFSEGAISLETPERLSRRLEKYLGRASTFLDFVARAVAVLSIAGFTFVHALWWARDRRALDSLAAIGVTQREVMGAHAMLGLGALVLGIVAGCGAMVAILDRMTDFWEQTLQVHWVLTSGRSQIMTAVLMLSLGMYAMLVSAVFWTWKENSPKTSASPHVRHTRRWWGIAVLVCAPLGLGLGLATGAMAGAITAVALVGSVRLAFGMLANVGRRSVAFPLRCAAARLAHDRWQAVAIGSTLALAIIATLTVQTGARLLVRQWGDPDDPRLPSVALLNVRSEEVATAKTLLGQGGSDIVATPLVSADLISVLPEKSDTIGNGEQRRRLEKRAYTVTYRSATTDTETVVAGEFEGARTPGDPIVPISISEKFAADGISLGDKLMWNVGGVSLATKVTSIRGVDFDRFFGGFAVVFPAGVLEGAPATFLVTAKARDATAVTDALRRTAEKLPHAVGFDLVADVATVGALLRQLDHVLQPCAVVMWALCILLAAAIAERLRSNLRQEDDVLHAMGALPTEIGQMWLIEGGLVAAVAGGLAVGCSIFTCEWICTRILEIGPQSISATMLSGASGFTGLAILMAAVAAMIFAMERNTRSKSAS